MTGLPLSALATSYPRSLVLYVLRTEVACGRVREEDGSYVLVPESFNPEVLAALRELWSPEPSSEREPDRESRMSLGDELARVLDGEPTGLSCDALARLVHRPTCARARRPQR